MLYTLLLIASAPSQRIGGLLGKTIVSFCVIFPETINIMFYLKVISQFLLAKQLMQFL